MSLKFLDPEALNILFFIHGRFTSSEGIYVPKNRLFVFVFILETLSYTAFRNCSDTFVCPKFRVGSHVVPPGDRVRKRSIKAPDNTLARPSEFIFSRWRSWLVTRDENNPFHLSSRQGRIQGFLDRFAQLMLYRIRSYDFEIYTIRLFGVSFIEAVLDRVCVAHAVVPLI